MLAMAVKPDPELVASMRAAVEAMARASEQTLSGLAESAGLAHTTLTRFLHGDVAHVLSARTLARLMDAAFARITALDETHPEGAQRRHDEWLQMRRLLNSPVPTFGASGQRPVFIVGKVGVDLPLTGELAPLHPSPLLADPRFPASGQFAVEVVGSSAAHRYPAGTVLLCVPPDHALETITNLEGRRVVTFERDREHARACARELRNDDDGALWAWCMSTLPTAPRPVPAPRDPLTSPWSEGITLVGVVIGSYRPE